MILISFPLGKTDALCVYVCVHTCRNMYDGGGGEDLFFISGNAALPEG